MPFFLHFPSFLMIRLILLTSHFSFNLLMYFFYIIFALLFFPSYIFPLYFPHRIYADSFFVTERELSLVSTTLIESSLPKTSSHAWYISLHFAPLLKSTCSLNSDVQKPVVSLRRQALSVPLSSPHLSLP